MFMIVSRDDFPLFELKIDSLVKGQVARSKQEIYEFIINAALDSVDQMQWQQQAMYLKNVDKFNDCLSVNCLVTPGNARLMILHENFDENKLK